MSDPNDPYSRLNYRKLIAWPARIEREAPFLKEVFGEDGQGRNLADLGCGTGEHAAFLSSLGFSVTGIDRSTENIEAARSSHPGVTFVAADMTECGPLLPAPLHGALTIGNTLPHLDTDEGLNSFLAAVGKSLTREGALLIQILNYTKIVERNERLLTPNLRPDDEGEILFLRLMTSRPGGRILFNPCTLKYRPGAEPPLEVVSARNVLLRAWQKDELMANLASTGYSRVEIFGGMRGEPFHPLDSPDLVVVARR
ncbi:MAG: methyltransferase domain-containing protein [Acidobacteria bacterium]|nr:methyltransferase domain-containing protein [Acidobacteriota bacterium]MCG3195279.1 hypothetical protein [Thermoanaerobaculia bacterium]MCK6683752.1 class I SAM-dependent methyltransferase [Thermoanaerobaculia bacterium]